MIVAEYKCGYCGSSFYISYFNSQDIPERNVGCTNCRMAGADIKLIKKYRDERSIKEKEATIPKTYTLRQLKKLGKKWLFVDLFLDSLAEQEKGEEGTKVPEMKIDPDKPFVPTEGMDKKITTHLLYPITVLESERDNIHGLPKSRADQLQGAIDILISERYKVVKEEFKAEVEKKKPSPLDALIKKCEKEDEKEQEKKYRKKFLKEK